MGDFVGYNGASMRSPHPSQVFEDGYVGVGSDGITIVSYSSGTQSPLTSLPPNSLFGSPGSIVHSGTGVWTFTFKQPFYRLMFADMKAVTPSGDTAVSVSLQSSTVGDNSATNTALPNVVFQVNTSGTPSELNAKSGFYFLFILQNTSTY